MLSKNIFFLRGNKNGQDRLYCIYKDNDCVKLVFDCKEEFCTNNIDIIFNCVCDKNGNIYILSKDRNGNIILNRKNDDIWEKSVIFRSNKNIENSYFYFDIVNNIPIMIYTISNIKNFTASMLYTYFINNRWSNPEFIDNIIIQNNIKFNIIDVEYEHKIIIYKGIDSTIKGREIILYPFKIGKSFEYIKNGNYVTDISVFVDIDKIHIGYISANRGRMGVYYKIKTDKVSSVRTIWEGRFADNIVLYKKGNIVYTMWYTDKGILKISNNFDSKIQRVYKNSQNIIKCKYNNTNGKGEIISNECLSLSNIKGEVLIFSKESLSFYGEERIKGVMESTENRNNFNVSNNIEIFNGFNRYNENQLYEISNELEQLYKKYSNLFIKYTEEKNKLKKELDIMLEKELDYIKNIDMLKKENYQLNNIIEDILYNDNSTTELDTV